MHDLNKQQVVLLCLLVSFVTSVATGITLVSLLDQSPAPVTQTINRVVERTVEKVIDQVEETTSGQERPVERIVETVVVNQEDLTVDAVDKNAKYLVRIYGHDRFGNRKPVGVGVVAGSDGVIVTDDTVALAYSTFEADYAEGTFKIALKKPTSAGVAVFVPQETAGKTFGFVSLGDSQSIKLAQSVIAVAAGGASNIVATGIITGLNTAAGSVDGSDVSASATPTQALTQIVTNVDPTNAGRGSMLLTLKGDVVGLKVGNVSGGTFLPINAVKALISTP
jgi:hypothetical protein